MSLVTKKPLIKQQTLHTEEYNSKSKISLSTKRVSFDSTTIQSEQSDSDEENSLGRSNRGPVKKPNSDDDLLNMFRSERSASDDDILQTEFEVKSGGTDESNPVPRNLRSKSSATDKDDSETSIAVSGNQQIDILEQTVNPKVKPRPQPRKMSGYGYFQEESHRALKPEVAPRKQLTDGETASDVLKSKSVMKYDTTEQDVDLSNFGGKKSMQSKHELSSSDDDDDNTYGGVYKIPKNRNILKSDSSKLNKGNSKPNEESYIQEKLTMEKPKLSRENNKVNSTKEIRPKDDVNNNDGVNLKKKYKGMVPAPKPRKHPQDGSQEDVSKLEQDYSDNDLGNTNKAPLPKGRKGQLQEKEIVSMSVLSKSRLHPLDEVDDDKDKDSGKTLKKISDKRVKIQPEDKDSSIGDEVDGGTKKGKALDWSSLDESSDGDDDETVGKNVNLFKKQRPSREKVTDNSNILEMEKISKPKPSPRTRLRKEPESMKEQWQEVSKKTMNYNDFSSSDYDSYQRIPREHVKLEKGQPNIPPRRITASQRPGSSKGRSNMRWAVKNEEITDMFEEHIPETDDVISVDDKQGWHRKDQLPKPRSPVTPKRGPMKAGLGIEEMTRSPQLRQTLMNDSEDDWDSLHHSFAKQKSSSLTNLNRTRESDYRNYYNEDDGPRRNSLDTETIRKTVYDNWLSRKNVTIKKELSQKALQKQKEEQKRKEEEERKLNAQLAYKTWNKHKTETLKEQHAKLKAKQKEQQEKIELERQMKEKDSKKYFESWKSKKDTIIKETHKEKKKEITEKKKKEAEDKLEKAMSSKKSFENWKSRKDVILKQQIKEKKKKEKLEESKKDDESYEKIIKNADEFQKWAEKKGKPRREPPPRTLTQRPWVPGGRYTSDCIPATVQPVILCPSSNRARTMSGTYRGKTKYYDF